MNKSRAPLVLITLISFLITGIIGPMPLYAQTADFRLPAPGVMVRLSPEFNAPVLKGIKVHPSNPFRFDFILDNGDSRLSNDALKVESSKLIKYFLSSITIPEKDLWVNLSPYEKDRIIPDSFGLTEMGRDLLAQDYLLKQVTSSLMYPEDEIGKKFWERIYQEAAKKYGNTNVILNTFNKVWIVPEKAVVYENREVGAAYVVESKLKVMLDTDYLSKEKNSLAIASSRTITSEHRDFTSGEKQSNDNAEWQKQIIREIIIPEITREVNEGKNFAQLRQVYQSLILATWYKKKIRDSIFVQVYKNKNKAAGIDIYSTLNKQINPSLLLSGSQVFDSQLIYQRYLQAFKKGVYNYIKEDVNPITKEIIPRRYFSGGAIFVDWTMNSVLEIKPVSIANAASLSNDNLTAISINVVSSLIESGLSDQAMNSLPRINDNDLVFSTPTFNYLLENGQARYAELREEIGEAGAFKEAFKEINVKGKLFRIILKQSGNNQPVFTLEDKQFRQFVKLKDWKLRNVEILEKNRQLPSIDEQDISFSQNGFNGMLSNGPKRWNELREEYPVVGDAENYKDAFKIIEIKGKKFKLLRKKSGIRAVFTLEKNEFKNFAQLKGWALVNRKLKREKQPVHRLEKITDNEVAFTQQGFYKIIVNGENVYQLFQKEHSLDSPDNKSKQSITIVSKGISFILYRKKSSGNRVDVFALDVERFKELAKLNGWKLRNTDNETNNRNLPKVDDQDVVFTTREFRNLIVSGLEKLREFRDKYNIPDTPNLDNQEYIEIEINGEKFRLIRKNIKKDVNMTVFTLNQNEFKSLAKLMGWEFRENFDEIIQKEGLESIISELSDDPQMLLGYLLLTSNLDPDVILRITKRSLEGFKGINLGAIDFSNFKKADGNIMLTTMLPNNTKEPSILIEGKVDGNFDKVSIRGDRSRDINVNKDGTFRTRVLLQAGEKVSLTLHPVNTDDETVGAPVEIKVNQTSKPKNFEEIIIDLLTTKEDIARKIAENPVKLAYLRKRLEISLLSYFTEDESEGFKYLNDKKSKLKGIMRELYEMIEEKFKSIQAVDIQGVNGFKIEGFIKGEHLFFYQKYALYDILQGIKDYESGRTKSLPAKVLALEQGLGKTLVSLSVASAYKEGALVIAPNSVVSTWAEQGVHFLKNSKVVPIYGGSSEEKTEKLNEAEPGAVRVINVEYLRSTEKARFEALNKNPNQLLFLDESQAFSREGTLQTQGALRLKRRYTILISATPFSGPQTARSLLKFMSNQVGMQDAKIFNDYFLDDPDSLRLLHFMIDQYVIRIKKKDVFKTYDPDVPLEKQNNRLAKKVYIEPAENGAFLLTDEQSDSILDLFFNWPEWKKNKSDKTKAHEAIHTQDDVERETSSGLFFAKMHSLRQLMNDPKYVGIPQVSPKHQRMEAIVRSEVEAGQLNKKGGKTVIFCAYKEQVKDYVKQFSRYGAVDYYGDTLSDQVNSDGYLVDKVTRIPLKFQKKNEFEYEIDKDGKLIPDDNGGYITALDYNRYRFQNDPNVKVIVATYDVGGVGVTFTAADAVIFDDLARDYTVMYQAEDRANRIDNLRKKYQTRYYRLEARYPASFLKRIEGKYAIIDPEDEQGQRMIIVDKKDPRLDEAKRREESIMDLHDIFSNGTYDQIQGNNIMNAQRRLFSLVLDGLEDEEDLVLIGEGDLKKRMPGLFAAERSKKNDKVESEEKNAKEVDDSAMIVNKRGGIDLTSTNMNLQTQSNGGEINFHIDPAMLQQLQNSPGFVPVIINIEPMTDLKFFLGVNS